MKDHYVLRWLKAALIRALKTFAQTAAAGLTVGATLQEINWTGLLSASALAFLYSMLTSCAGLPEVQAEAQAHPPDQEATPPDEEEPEEE